ncbi:bifunctional protein-serine/threonine kinase/phosphatase [Methylomonas rhizoryzae]|uniref:bifunctional protein-serine/threonine kinase/phosphatase n=1 Tax=Methylomonas rhizoryzae TaxID=2608981 RepID=UPI001231F708|nr:bifunctional protein-serine/threonine kinase/phosphatase [Methylomonas rhizoryzae]
MAKQLRVSIGQHSDKGRKPVNQDFYGCYAPKEPQLGSKGIAVALADGISSSDVSQIASKAAVIGFLEDYYCTSEAWSVKKSAQRVLTATNSWLYAHTRQSQYRYDTERGYVCTFSALVLKSATAHLFHVGDTRIYRLQNAGLEQLTQDHRLRVSQQQSYLSRALGMDSHLEIDYQALGVEAGDTFILATDGVYEFASESFIVNALREYANDLDAAAIVIIAEAMHRQSDDNLTIQIVRVEELPDKDAAEAYRQLTELPFPPPLQARMNFDGYTIVRSLHTSNRSHVFLAMDGEQPVVIKTPATDLRHDAAYLERFQMEDWIARRVNSPHVLKPCPQTRKAHYLYLVSEFIDGQTLKQWMIDNPKPDLATVRSIIEQIGKGLQAFHRLEMLHQDIRPENIMIDKTGSIKIIDFGSTRVAGLIEALAPAARTEILGTAQYTAPEYFLGESGSNRSDIFSLGVLAYQMLSGRLPYGLDIAKCTSRAAQCKLTYRTVLDDKREIPAWIDEVLKKAVHINPYRRYEELSEFLFDLRQPNKAMLQKVRPPLLERRPLLFWQSLSALLAITVLLLLIKIANH